mmetsp:Transcript_72885/g.190152  ORF Transcript_72885/g.190152 Transcript_72885/m.190152 type:complete len:251 (+) Transcript_72885:3-755(+)
MGITKPLLGSGAARCPRALGAGGPAREADAPRAAQRLLGAGPKRKERERERERRGRRTKRRRRRRRRSARGVLTRPRCHEGVGEGSQQSVHSLPGGRLGQRRAAQGGVEPERVGLLELGGAGVRQLEEVGRVRRAAERAGGGELQVPALRRGPSVARLDGRRCDGQADGLKNRCWRSHGSGRQPQRHLLGGERASGSRHGGQERLRQPRDIQPSGGVFAQVGLARSDRPPRAAGDGSCRRALGGGLQPRA